MKRPATVRGGEDNAAWRDWFSVSGGHNRDARRHHDRRGGYDYIQDQLSEAGWCGQPEPSCVEILATVDAGIDMDANGSVGVGDFRVFGEGFWATVPGPWAGTVELVQFPPGRALRRVPV
jgi:hypothetical protein